MMYQAILFAPDGDYVTDFSRESIEEVNSELADMGSRWYFYPLAFVIRDKTPGYTIGKDLMRQRIVDAPPEMDTLIGKSVATVKALFVEHAETLCENLNNNFPVLAGITE
jgi:hypothetical protein